MYFSVINVELHKFHKYANFLNLVALIFNKIPPLLNILIEKLVVTTEIELIKV